MDIDPVISNWILEFLLRQPLKDRTLYHLLRTLQLPDNNPKLKISLLLRKLESEISRNSITESSLETLEQLEELLFLRGIESDNLKRAYCSVAVHCTKKYLIDGGVDLFDDVMRIWRGRVGRMEKLMKKGGLCSDELRMWKDEFEAAVWENTVRESVLKKSDEVDAFSAVRFFLSEEWDRIGPSFIELVAERVKDDEEGLNGVLGFASEKEENSRDVGWETDGNNGSKDTQKGEVNAENKHFCHNRSRGNVRGAKITDSVELAAGPSHTDYNLQCSEKVNRVRKALESSSNELQAVVKDPLPDALKIAEKISGMVRENDNQDNLQVNHEEEEDNTFIVYGFGVVQSTGCNVSNEPKPSLMERNSTAHTYEWDDSIGGSQEDSADQWDRIHLPSPRKINVSPLRKYEMKNLKRRRKVRKWSTIEEDTLRTGVEKYGRGNWKAIITIYHDIFEDRTEVDLKDKWRNLMRY